MKLNLSTNNISQQLKAVSAKGIKQAQMPTIRIASLSKTLGLLALLGLSTLSVNAAANNGTNDSQVAQVRTELPVNQDSIITTQQKIIDKNSQIIAHKQAELDKAEQIKQQEKIIKQQERDLKNKEIEQNLKDFYSNNKKGLWGSLAAAILLLGGLNIRHRVYHMEKHNREYSPADMSDYPIAKSLYERRFDTRNWQIYCHEDTRNFCQKIVDFFIDRGLHYTVEEGFTYTPFKTPKPVDPIKTKHTWELENKLIKINTRISHIKLLLKNDNDFGLKRTLESLEADKKVIEAELAARK